MFVVIRIAMRLGIIIGSLFYFVLFHSIQFQFVCLFVYYVLHITYIKPYTTTRKVKKYKKVFYKVILLSKMCQLWQAAVSTCTDKF